MLTVVGILVALAAIALATIMDGNSFAPLLGPSSFLLVSLGAIGATIAGFELSDLKQVPRTLVRAVTGRAPDPDQVVTDLTRMAEVARKSGVLAMENELEEVDHPFLRMGLQQVVDGLDPQAVREVLELELDGVEQRHATLIGFWRTLAGYSPTFGMVGTVVGLINMLGQLSDPSQLGIGMSLALLTTLYGVLLANLVYLPLASRLQRLHDQEMEVADLVIEGIEALQGGASPRRLVERLEARLQPERRVGLRARTNPAEGDEVAGEAAA